MNQDISQILDGWDFDPHELTVRVINGRDGTPLIQMRIDLGLLQMTMDGRPDGKRPHGFESLLDYYESQANEYGKGYVLSSEAMEELHREGYQYYQRYLCLYHLGYYSLVVRDTERNLRLFAFVKRYAKRRRDQRRFDQYRPYLLMMQTRARAMMALATGDRDSALERIREGRQAILDFLQESETGDAEIECFELEFLTKWYEELKSAQASGGMDSSFDSVETRELDELKSLLQKAVDREDYEYAALLRDQIRRIEQDEQANEV